MYARAQQHKRAFMIGAEADSSAVNRPYGRDALYLSLSLSPESSTVSEIRSELAPSSRDRCERTCASRVGNARENILRSRDSYHAGRVTEGHEGTIRYRLAGATGPTGACRKLRRGSPDASDTRACTRVITFGGRGSRGKRFPLFQGNRGNVKKAAVDTSELLSRESEAVSLSAR